MLKPTTSLLAIVLLCGLGCERFTFMEDFRSQNPEPTTTKSLKAETTTKVETPLIGEFVNVSNLNAVTLEGVGLVTGLPGTGGDHPVSPERTRLLDDMRRRNIPNPNQILQSRDTALVVVRAYLPPLVDKREYFDVEVYVPGQSNESDVKSLNGGFLLETYLSEKAFISGEGMLEGHTLAKAGGSILVGTLSNSDQAADQRGTLLRGKIPRGAMALKQRDMALLLRNEYRSERMAYRIATRIGDRYYDYEVGGQRVALAEAKTNELIELKLHHLYKDNYPRYLQVIRAMSLKESEVAQRVRMQQLQEDLHNPVTSERASIALEAIGKSSIDILKTGLKHPSLEVRFYSAVALAYLEDASGVKILAEIAENEPAFRVYAFAAMAVIDDGETYLHLRNMLDLSSAETRYGAFLTLRALDAGDPLVAGEVLSSGFRLHVLDVSGDPMIHFRRRKEAELVVFGRGQQFTMPLVMRAGKNIMVTARDGDDKVSISKITLNKTDRREVPNNLVEVVRTVAELGASYPDVAQMLIEAERQSNLVSRLEMDALPKGGRTYQRKADEFQAAYQAKARIGRSTTVPNIFSDDDHTEDPQRQTKRNTFEDDMKADSEEELGQASSADVTSDEPATAADSSSEVSATKKKPTQPVEKTAPETNPAQDKRPFFSRLFSRNE